MKGFFLLSKFIVLTVFLAVFSCVGITNNFQDREIVIASIQEPPPSPPVDPDPPPPPPDPFTAV